MHYIKNKIGKGDDDTFSHQDIKILKDCIHHAKIHSRHIHCKRITVGISDKKEYDCLKTMHK